MFGLIAVLVVLIVVLIFLAQTVKIVPQSRVGIIQRFGRYHRTAESGLTFVIPVADQMLPNTDLREQVVAFQPHRSSPTTTSGCRSRPSSTTGW